jgi:hypothetical protein
MAQTPEYVPVLTKLLEKTRQRKIDWKATYDELTFLCAIEGQYAFSVSKGRLDSGEPYRALIMRDKDQVEIFNLQATAPTPASSSENDALFVTIDELHDEARRIALDIDKKVAAVADILDNI